MDTDSNLSTEVKTKKCGLLTIEWLPSDLEHLPQYGMFRIDETLTIKLAPIDRLHKIVDPLEELFNRFKGTSPTIEQAMHAVNVADHYVPHRVCAETNVRGSVVYELIHWDKRLWEAINPESIIMNDLSKGENIRLLNKAVRDHQLNRDADELLRLQQAKNDRRAISRFKMSGHYIR